VGNEALALLKGTLDLLIMKTLSLGPLHGYEIAKWVQRKTNDALTAMNSVLRAMEA